MKTINCARCNKEIEFRWQRKYCIKCRKIMDDEYAKEYCRKQKEKKNRSLNKE